jgi:hypothetical protein
MYGPSRAFHLLCGALLLMLCACSGTTSSVIAPVPASSHAKLARAAAAASTIDLSSVSNVVAIANAGVPVPHGGLDGRGYAYAAALTGTSLDWNGETFALLAPDVFDAVSNAGIPLPAVSGSSLALLATGVNGNQINQVFILRYTDGTTVRLTQSLSDWHTPQSYPGESIAASFAYRLTGSGSLDTRSFQLYGYQFPLDPTKTLQSLTLPGNRNVVVLSLSVAAALATTATPTFSPLPGTFAAPQSIALSDGTPGASIYYTRDGTTPSVTSTPYAGPISVSTTTTLKAIALASGYSPSAIAVGTFTINASAVDVALGTAANVVGLANGGSPVPQGGLDTRGNAYAGALLGSSINWNGVLFTLGSAGKSDATTRTVVALPSGTYSKLLVLATAVNGNQLAQQFVVTYADGTTSSFTQSLSDWHTPQQYTGESIVSSMPYRITASGGIDSRGFDLYGYVFSLDAAKVVKSLTLPNNRNVVVLGIALTTAASLSCDPLTYGAVADGKTDNTLAIQSAISACAALGGGVVPLKVVGGQSVYLTGPISLLSHVHLDVGAGATLQGTNDHTRYVPAYINWVYQTNEALISAQGQSDVAITGSGIIDGAGGQVQPDGGPSWWSLTGSQPNRPWLIEFYQCNGVTLSGITLQNSPFWTQALRFSNAITETGVTVKAPDTSPNTDGVDVVGSTNVTLTNLVINVGDDNIAIKSGLPIDPNDPKQQGIPRMAASQIEISAITAGSGHGISIGSEAVNGVNHVTIRNVQLTYTGNGFRLKSARDRGGEIYAISVQGLTMKGVALPLSINDYYPALGGPQEPPYQAAQPITATTPHVHDISITDLTATGANVQSFIEGLPESCIDNVTLSNVSIQTSTPGLVLRHVTGSFHDVTVTPPSGDPPFLVQENVSVTATGTTAPIATTPPQAGQTACNAQNP